MTERSPPTVTAVLMEAPNIVEMGDVCHPRVSSPEGETVCEALSRFENTLQGAIRDIHSDVSTFKLRMSFRLEEMANISVPLGGAVVQLQQENQQLRSQLEALTHQVELLGSITCDRSSMLNNNVRSPTNGIHGNHQEIKEMVHRKDQTSNQSQAHFHVQTSTSGSQGHISSNQSCHFIPLPPPTTSFSFPTSSPPPVSSRITSIVTSPVSSSSPSIAHYSSRATFAVSSKTNSIDREDLTEVDPGHASVGQENKHVAVTEHLVLVHGKISPPTECPQEHAAPFATRMPHVPITAVTKTAELPVAPRMLNGSHSSPMPEVSSPYLSMIAPHPQPVEQYPIQLECSLETKTTTPATALQDKTHSVPVKSVSYSGLPQQNNGVTPNRSFGRVSDRRRELVRSQTLPRNIGTQSRRPVLEKLDIETSNSQNKQVESKPKLKRSQSFGVSSASTIKQILLEWCRLKTTGYLNIDIQNFSSSWSDGMAFCALVHSFFPSQFDYSSLSPANRKHNFELAFGTAETKANCDRLIEVEDMMIMGHKPDPMCVFTYVQSLYNHLRKFE
ncbi:smoothelin, like [Gouania willdenowi]|uniref:Smoothelin-like protein 2 n=1 Tax=Gouania willdenowi TaxID=441366 RepID=A0A8C5E2T7_GOUWI|nr:smoothelin-like protein 2 [Gouania willdenowi]